jgi:hypothetical protein
MWNNLNCADCEGKLSEYVENVLGADEQKAVELHLHSCRSCGEIASGMRLLIEVGRDFPVYMPPPWLAARIVANTPPARVSFRNRLAAFWQSLGEPRTALAIFTAAIVMGWIGDGNVREAVFDRAEGVVSCAYDRAVRTYYRSPVIMEIHSRFDQFMENS